MKKGQEILASTIGDMGEGKTGSMPMDVRIRPIMSGLLGKVLANQDSVSNEIKEPADNAKVWSPDSLSNQKNVLEEAQKLYRGSYQEDPSFWKQV